MKRLLSKAYFSLLWVRQQFVFRTLSSIGSSNHCHSPKRIVCPLLSLFSLSVRYRGASTSTISLKFLESLCRSPICFRPELTGISMFSILIVLVLSTYWYHRQLHRMSSFCCSAWLPEKDVSLIAIAAEQIAFSLVDNVRSKVLSNHAVPWFTCHKKYESTYVNQTVTKITLSVITSTICLDGA